MKHKRHLRRDRNGFSTILESLIAVGISITLLTIFLYSVNTMYTVQDKPGVDLKAKSVGILETLINSPGQNNSTYPSWEDDISPFAPRALGLGTSPTIEYGVLSIESGKVTIEERYGNSRSDIGEVKTCFLAGTKVVTADKSYKNIEDIVVGDKIKSYDEETGEIVEGIVTQVFHHDPEKMTDYYLVINNQLRVTPNHLVYSNGEWIEASNLHIGDSLFYSQSDYKIYLLEKIFEKTLTYNFEVQDSHNYFVAFEDVDMLVHNSLTADADGPYHEVPGEPIQFEGDVVEGGSDYTWHWDFGDDTTSNEKNPQHSYSSQGTYDVVLTVTALTSPTSDTDETKAYIYWAPYAEFEWFDQDGLDNGKTVFFNAEKSSGEDITYWWDWDGKQGSVYSYEEDNDEDTTTEEHNFALDSGDHWEVSLKINNTGGDTDFFNETVYVNRLNVPEPEPEPWVLTSKNIHPMDDETFLSYGEGYYVKYPEIRSGPTEYKLFEVKEKRSPNTPILDFTKIENLSSHNGDILYYNDLKESLGLESEQTLYNFNITITRNNPQGGEPYYSFGASYENAIAVESSTREVLIYHRPTLGVDNIERHPYYEIADITVHVFIGGKITP